MRRMTPALAVAGILYSCASIGRPEGGAYDDTPPRFLGSTPEAGAVNNSKQKISILFDEYIKLEKPSEKVVISPPQLQQPEIRAVGKRIQVNLLDSLKPGTTYTIDFGDAVVDNNEGNPLGQFTFTFSTGASIDTMEVSGTVLEASNLEPLKGIMVGLHSNLADTAFTSLPLERVGRTDSRGRFTIKGVAPGKYRIFALMDADNNYRFNQPGEVLAWEDSLIIPQMEARLRQDTSWVDSLSYDTIVERSYTHYLPDNILLRAFKEENRTRSLTKHERLTPEKFTLYFTGKSDTLPRLRGLNFDEREAFVVEHNRTNDTITYWLKDSLVYLKDTLSMSLTYYRTDSLKRFVSQTDTLKLVAKQQPRKKNEETKKKKNKDEEAGPPPVVPLDMRLQIGSPMEVYGAIAFVFNEPPVRVDTASIHLKQRVDSIWKPVPFDFEQDSTDLKAFNLYHDWEPMAEYELTVDSAAFQGLYGLVSFPQKQNFKVRSEDEYFSLTFNVQGVRGPAFIELLDTQDRVLRRRRLRADGQADFYFLMPGKYGARLVEDRNNNGVWDTGNYERGEQPETVYYYPQIMEYKALWEANQTWNLHDLAPERQKPDELKKQKPDDEKKKRDRNRQRQQRRNNTPQMF